MANNDKVYLAYSGQLGENFEIETQNRINWIVTQAAKSNSLLDIGCSQGIVSILLAEQGKKVTGLDIQPEAIEYAENLLEQKYSNVKENITFKCINFMEYEDILKYDCIIITEVLEHLQEPDLFLKRVANFLKEDGKLIISVPFGVMEHPDHYSTFYMTDFYDLVSKYFTVNTYEFMERWMGITASLKTHNRDEIIIDKNMIKLQEKNFKVIDRKMSQRIEELYNNLLTTNEKYKETTERYAELKGLSDEKCERELTIRYKELVTTIEVIEGLNRKVQRLNNQRKELADINEQYRVRLEKIEANAIWKAEIKIYRKLKAIKHKFIK